MQLGRQRMLTRATLKKTSKTGESESPLFLLRKKGSFGSDDDHHVRLYDTRAQRRPVQSVEIGSRPFTCCTVSHDENSLFTGDTIGRVSQIDLRTMRLNGTYKGNTGSVREIALHPTMEVLATVGLDRVMRVFDISTRKQLHRVYLRQKLNCVLVSSEGEVATFTNGQEESKSDSSLVQDDEDLVNLSEEE